MKIRKAEEKDLAQLLAIYNYEVEHSTSTFDLTPKTMEQQRCWLHAHNKENHPLIVAEEKGRILGYASLSPYREKEAYRATVELSVYVDYHFRRKGVAGALMEEILREAAEDSGTETVVSVITSGNEVSIRLHEKYGFIFCGTIPNVGKKFGKKLSIDNYCLPV